MTNQTFYLNKLVPVITSIITAVNSHSFTSLSFFSILTLVNQKMQLGMLQRNCKAFISEVTKHCHAIQKYHAISTQKSTTRAELLEKMILLTNQHPTAVCYKTSFTNRLFDESLRVHEISFYVFREREF